MLAENLRRPRDKADAELRAFLKRKEVGLLFLWVT
jgi:hypothetical protein